MNALQVMDRYRKEVIQVSTLKNDVKVQYLYDRTAHYFLVRIIVKFFGGFAINSTGEKGRKKKEKGRPLICQNLIFVPSSFRR